MERLFVDTSAWIAYTNRADPDHQQVKAWFASFEGRLVTSNAIFSETVTLCLYRLGHHVAAQVGEVLREPGTVDLVRLSNEDEEQAWQLFLKRSDKTYSYTDCTSFILMRKLGLRRAVALDADFEREGFEVVPKGP